MKLKRSIDTTKNDEEARCRKRQRQSNTRNVKFATAPTIVEFEKYGIQTKAEIWYSREDFQVFQFERILSVQCLQRVVAGDKTPVDPNLVCFRGLEPYRSEQRREKFLRRRQDHVAVILEEQDRQRAECDEDPGAFRDLVAFSSHNTLKIAQYQALIDRHEAGMKKTVKSKAETSTNTQVEGTPAVLTPTLQSVAVRAA